MELTGIRLAILSILLVLTERCSGEKENEIDWKRCNSAPDPETICYVPKSCKNLNGPKFERLDDTVDLKKDPGKCDTGIQFKPYGKRKWLVYMQVKEAQLNLAEGMWIEGENSQKLFGCKKAANIEYFGADKLKKKKFVNAEEVFTTDRIFCAFTIDSGDEYLQSVLGTEGGRKKLQIKFKAATEKTTDVETASVLSNQIDRVVMCNPDNAIFDKTFSSDILIRQEIPIVDLNRNVCPDPSQKLFVKYPETGEYVESTNVECKKDGNNDYKFVYTKMEGQTAVTIANDANFNVHCASNACTQCAPIDATGMSEKCGISNFTKGTKGTNGAADQCATATCETTQGNWEYEDMDGNKGVLVTTVACKKKRKDDLPVWFITLANKTEVEVKTAWCSKEIDCASKNPLKYECHPDLKNIKENKNTICAPPNATEPFCQDDRLRIRKEGDSKEQEREITSVYCDKRTGSWQENKEDGDEIESGTYVYCAAKIDAQPQKGAAALMYSGIAAALVLLMVGSIIYAAILIRRYRKYTPSEREQRIRPKFHWYRHVVPEKLIVEDLAILKEWTDAVFDKILDQWLKFSVYERYKFAERVGFELGVTTSCDQFFTLLTRIFEVETDYRVWQVVMPVFKLLHVQSAEKENNLDCDKRLRKWCISKCKPILERVGWDGCNNEYRETAYLRYVIFNLMYYCEDKEFIEKLVTFFDKGGYHGLHSINRQIAWAAAIREKDHFDVAKKVAEEAFCDKNARREIEARRAAKEQASSGGIGGWSKTKSKTMSDAPSGGQSSKSNKGGSNKSKKGVKGGSKESKSVGSKEGSKSGKSNRSNKSKEDKKGSKETPSGKGKKGNSKEGTKSDKSGKSGKSGKDKKGGSKEAGKGKGRDKAGADEMKGDSGKEKKEPQSDKDKKKDRSGKDKKDKSNKSNKSSKEKKSGKDKKTTSGKENKENASGKEKTGASSKSKSGKSSKEKKDGSKKSMKEAKTGIDKSSKSKKSMKTTSKKKKNTKIGLKERRDADGDKLHGDRAQHIFFAIGSCRNKEQIASFLDHYIDCKEYDPSNLVYLFQGTLEWDDTRANGIDLFLNMNKDAWKKMPPGHRYHMRILKNFKRYVVGELDLQKLQSHIVNDSNYTAAQFRQIDPALMLKRIQNNVTFQPQLIEDLDSALKKLNF